VNQIATPAGYALGATCIAFNGTGQVLITLRRSPRRWELPGGLVEPGEGFQAAAERETLEETGVTVRVHGLVGLYQHPSRGILAGLFTATALRGTPQPTAEASAAEWAQVDDALKILHPLYRPRLQDALAARHTVALRVHDGAETLSMLAVRPVSHAGPRESC
jgi:8-oxo-dGTP diphosphatase